MFNNKVIYLALIRERTKERIVVPLSSGMERIKKYDQKQQFMNMLGQDTFWKKNRLDLWSALKELEVADYLLIQDNDAIMLANVAFQNTPIMLNSIKDRLKHEVEQLIQEDRDIKTTGWTYDDHNHIYQNGEREFVNRAVRVHIPHHYIRTEDVTNFDQDFNRLLDKYAVKDPLRLKNGKKRFNFRTVANRYVERVFGFKADKYDPYW